MIPKKFRAWTGKEMVEVTDLTIFSDGSTKVNDDVDSHYDKWPVMQFTGVYDCNGVEIYEGDIVNSKVFCYLTEDYQGTAEKALEVAYYSDPHTKAPLLKLKEPDEIGDQIFYNIGRNTFVIGNIYETPDLL